MDGIRHGKLPEGLSLQLDQLVTTVVHGARDTPVLPAGVCHVAQLLELLAHAVFAPALLRQAHMTVDAGPAGDQLLLKLDNGLGDLSLDFGAHSGQAQEVAVQDTAGGEVEVDGGADDATALELVEGLAGPAEDEEDEDQVADSVCVTPSVSRRRSGGLRGSVPVAQDFFWESSYMSRFSASSWLRGVARRWAWKVSRRLTGSLDEPGIFVVWLGVCRGAQVDAAKLQGERRPWYV